MGEFFHLHFYERINVMKKILSLVLASAMLASMAVVTNANPANSHTITAAYGTPVIDGQMDDIWNNAEMQVQDSFRSGTETDAKAQIRTMYDDNYFYVLAYVPDNTLWTSDLTLAEYTYDTVECCVSLTNSEATSYDGVFDWWVGVTPYGVRNTGSNCTPLIGGGTDVNDAEYLNVHTSLENDPENDTAEGYYVEYAFNVKAIDEELVMDAGTTIGMEVSVNDNAEYNGRTMCMGWADTTDAASGNPSTFGNVVFGAKGGASEAPAATATDSVEPTILWDFNADEEMSAVMSGANAVSYFGDTVDGTECYEFIASGNDPYVSVNISADDAENVAWAKVRAKNPSYATAIELFGATGGRALAGSECTHVELKTEDDTWYTYLIYVPDENVKTVNAYKDPQYAITEPYWAGTVEYIRLDPLWREGDDGSDAGGNMVGGENIYIDYVAFFPTKEAALAFRPELDNYAFPEQGPAAVEAPVEEAPVEEVVETPVEEVAPVEEVVEAPAEEVAPVEEVVEEAPVVEEVVEEVAPQTFDFGVIAAVTAVLSLAGFAVSKKR